MTSEDQDLMLRGKASQLLRHGSSALGVEVDEHIVHDQRQRDAAARELRRQPEAKAKVELLRRASAQLLGALVLRVAIQNNQALAILLLENPLISAGGHPCKGAGRFLEHGWLSRAGEFLQSAGDQFFG